MHRKRCWPQRFRKKKSRKGPGYCPSAIRSTLILLFQQHFTLPPLSLVCALRPIAAHSGLARILWLISVYTTASDYWSQLRWCRPGHPMPTNLSHPHGWPACSWPPDALVAIRDPPDNSDFFQSVIIIAVWYLLSQSEDFRPFGSDLDVRHFTWSFGAFLTAWPPVRC